MILKCLLTTGQISRYHIAYPVRSTRTVSDEFQFIGFGRIYSYGGHVHVDTTILKFYVYRKYANPDFALNIKLNHDSSTRQG